MEIRFLTSEGVFKKVQSEEVNKEVLIELSKKLGLGDEFIFSVVDGEKPVWLGQVVDGEFVLSIRI